jgi:hypothetical protein
MKMFLSILLSATVFIVACRKDDTGVTFQMPEKTQSGNNTFGFMLNSSVWTNYGQACFPFMGGCRENLSGHYTPDFGYVTIDADKVLYKDGSWNTIENIALYLTTHFTGTRTYSTLARDTISVSYIKNEQGQPDITYLLSDTNPVFTISIIKIDTLNHIMAGEFSGKLFRRIDFSSYATSATDSLIITDGRFDVKF